MTAEIPVVPVKAEDPTGAGDAFCGGFLVGMLQNRKSGGRRTLRNRLGFFRRGNTRPRRTGPQHAQGRHRPAEASIAR